jgi:hypothetical protein
MTSNSSYNSELLTSVEGLRKRPKLVLAQGLWSPLSPTVDQFH